MKINQFLEHHGVATNPFADEDAQTDQVFKDHCIASAYHPTWDKVYGDPSEPATSIVFGEKGSGKTAMRLQIVRHLHDYNRTHPNQRLFVIEYDDFNPFLDRFRDKLSARRRRPEQVLAEWKLWDHMDAILSLGVTRLVDGIFSEGENAARHSSLGRLEIGLLDRLQARDLLLLAACYDQSTAEPLAKRWHRLRRKLKFRTWQTQWRLPLGILVAVVLLAVILWQGWWGGLWSRFPWAYLVIAAGFAPWAWHKWKWFWPARAVSRQTRVVDHQPGPLSKVLRHFTGTEIQGQPLPNKDRTDDRYELLAKFQSLLKTLGFTGIIVLVDRVDEPHMINGSAEKMRALLWPMLDNKFLKHPGIGFKLLLPIELAHYIEREDRDFYQRARLDKQNMVPSLQWSGEALYDVANARVKACAVNGSSPTLRSLFDERVSDRRLIDALRGLRVPRHLFKFMYRLFVAHSNAYTDDNPVWKIGPETFESVLALFGREQDAFERGVGAG